jgi:hypothetical protein
MTLFSKFNKVNICEMKADIKLPNSDCNLVILEAFRCLLSLSMCKPLRMRISYVTPNFAM